MWACSNCLYESHVLQELGLHRATRTGQNTAAASLILLPVVMLVLKTLSPWMLVSVLALLSVGSGARDRGRSKGVTRAQRSGNRPSRGRFTLSSGMQCSWETRDLSDAVKLSVKCENPAARASGGVTGLKCEYKARPQKCPGYQSDPRGYYKQVSRSLKKLQGKLCRDDHALVKAGMCKRAPRDTHFKLDLSTSVASAQSGEDPTPPPSTTTTTTSTTTSTTTRTTTRTIPAAPGGTPGDCKGRADHRKVAQEYCDSSWASVCAFFFSMLQSDDC